MAARVDGPKRIVRGLEALSPPNWRLSLVASGIERLMKINPTPVGSAAGCARDLGATPMRDLPGPRSRPSTLSLSLPCQSGPSIGKGGGSRRPSSYCYGLGFRHCCRGHGKRFNRLGAADQMASHLCATRSASAAASDNATAFAAMASALTI